MGNVIKMSEGGKSERVVNVTVNNNTSSGAKSNGTIASTSSLISINDGSSNRRPLSQVKPVSTSPSVSTTTAALVQAYLTLNNNLRAPNNAMVTSAPSVSVAPIKEIKCAFYVKVINPDKKKEFSTYMHVKRYHQGKDIISAKIAKRAQLTNNLVMHWYHLSWISLWGI